MENEYKSAKEAFVSGMTGSSLTRINLISLCSWCASIALYAAVRTRLPPTRQIGFIPSFILLVLPVLLSMTLFARLPGLLSFLQLIPTALLVMLLPRKEVGTPLPSSQPKSPTVPVSPRVSEHRLPPLPSLTTYRAHMMLLTVIAILAVDFPVFPRELAKCETFGMSMMDLGVGSFVFSQGVVSAIPLLKDPSYLTSPFGPKLYRVTKKCLPIIALGAIRVLLVKGTEYPEHETEYGTHWNFFITLALLPVLQVFMHPIILRLPISLLGVLLAAGEYLVVHLEAYVLSAPRTSIISANKEGIVSLPGYLAIHLLGLSVGTIVLPPSPHSSAEGKKPRGETLQAQETEHLSAPRQISKTAAELCSYAILWWVFLAVARFAEVVGLGLRWWCFRRMVNLPYILWVAAFNTSFLLAYLVLDMATKQKGGVPPDSPLIAAPLPSERPEASTVECVSPPLLEAINKHSLVLFLLANVMTGVINLSMSTMYASDAVAMSVLTGYTLVVCGIAWVWDGQMKNRA
ncbi:GWT1-domain-containing protein [Cyathus striatus]|nr:GWT1-domain-containing protein [Cyathus striatus]